MKRDLSGFQICHQFEKLVSYLCDKWLIWSKRLFSSVTTSEHQVWHKWMEHIDSQCWESYFPPELVQSSVQAFENEPFHFIAHKSTFWTKVCGSQKRTHLVLCFSSILGFEFFFLIFVKMFDLVALIEPQTAIPWPSLAETLSDSSSYPFLNPNQTMFKIAWRGQPSKNCPIHQYHADFSRRSEGSELLLLPSTSWWTRISWWLTAAHLSRRQTGGFVSLQILRRAYSC